MENCLFCDIVSGRKSADRVFEDEYCIGFRDINPQAPTHVLVIPREHITSLNEIGGAPQGLADRMIEATREIAARLQLDRHGYRVVINTGSYGGQTVSHLHIHLLGGRPMHWPPG